MARQGLRAEPRERTVGVVHAVGPTGQLIARTSGERFPTEGTVVVDATGRYRGRVTRVFGPVARPYFAVRLRRTPNPAEGVALVGQPLVAEFGRPHATG
ncbi:MAG: H/ACA RNA-protein complex component Gar1 [Thermoplasmata archaeon]|nr:H/ACA RNA-protein complex component Gar1 [Thermoplasmata archaeon]MCI4333421.1 H/ACA RNA-protein complex component Gar1 [Thermoplasmata archaeon]